MGFSGERAALVELAAIFENLSSEHNNFYIQIISRNFAYRLFSFIFITL
jgi:hypothetical protein